MRRMNRVCQCILLIWIAIPLSAQPIAEAKLQDIHAYIDDAMPKWPVPGMAIAIVEQGEVVFARGYGVRDVKSGGKVDANTLFAIASNSKAFTAAALAMQVDAGRLDWDDPVTDHLPYFQLHDACATREMRVRDLLCHRSGLGTFSGDLLWYGTGYSAAEVVRRVRYLPPRSSFRYRYGYSNLMFIAAGEVLASVSGKCWPDYIRQEVLQPLGMTNSVLSITEIGERQNVATPHKQVEGKAVPVDWVNWDSMAAAGGIISSVQDMARWLILQLGRGAVGEKRLFSEAQSRAMWSAHTAIPVSERSMQRYPSTHFRAYGLGWGLMDYQGHKVVQHGGGYDGMYSRVVLVPEKELGFVILTNAMTSLQTALSYRILDSYLAEPVRDWSAEFADWSAEGRKKEAKRKQETRERRVADTKPSLALKEYAGTFGGDLYGDASISVEEGKLVLRFKPNPDLVADLQHWHYDTFEIKWRKDFAWFGDGRLQFLLDQFGAVTQFKMDVPNDDLFFDELTFDRREE